MTVTQHAITPLLGVSLSQQDTDQVFKLGTMVQTNEGAIFRYVSFAAAKTAADVLEITEDWAVTDQLTTTTDGDAPLALGVFVEAKTTPASGSDYGWIQTAGNFPAIGMLVSCAPETELFSTSTAGHVDDATAGKLINGLKATHAANALDGGAANSTAFSRDEIRLYTDA